MARSTDNWLRNDPSDHISRISSSVGCVGDSSRVVSRRALGFHVDRFVFDDLVVSDCERGTASSYRTVRWCVK